MSIGERGKKERRKEGGGRREGGKHGYHNFTFHTIVVVNSKLIRYESINKLTLYAILSINCILKYIYVYMFMYQSKLNATL